MGRGWTWTLAPTPQRVGVWMKQSGFRPQNERNYRGAQCGSRLAVGLESVAAGQD